MATEVELFEFNDIPSRPGLRGYVDANGDAKISAGGVDMPTFATDPLTGAVIGMVGPGGGVSARVDGTTANPIIQAFSYTGTAVQRLIELGFEPDLVILMGSGQYPVTMAREHWYGNIQSFGHTALSGSDGVPPPFVQRQGFTVSAAQSAINSNGVVYYGVAIKDNGSGILKTFAYNGFRSGTVGAPDNQGTVSNAVTMDLIDGSNPEIVYIKRDATGAGHEGVWVTHTFAKKDTAAAVNNALLTLSAGGSMGLSTDIAVNENNGGIVGEAHNCFSLHSSGRFWDILTYTGNGANQTVPANGRIATAIIIPQAAQACEYWINGMGTSSKDGGQTALNTGRFYGSGSVLSIGASAACNTVGTTYKALVFYETLAPVKVRPTSARTAGVKITTSGSGRVACGTDVSLALAGAHSLEWIGAISEATTEQFIMGRIGAAATGSRGTPAAGSCNYAISYARDPDAGIEICTSDQFSSEVTDASKQRRWRTGIVLRPFQKYHVLYTHDGVDKWVLYIDGVPVKWRRLPMSVFGLNGITATAGLNMSFGARHASGTGAAADMTLHQLGRIYNRALSAAGASHMYARNYLGVTINDISDSGTALVEEWKFKEGTGTTVAASKNATNNGNVTTGVYVNF